MNQNSNTKEWYYEEIKPQIYMDSHKKLNE